MSATGCLVVTLKNKNNKKREIKKKKKTDLSWTQAENSDKLLDKGRARA